MMYPKEIKIPTDENGTYNLKVNIYAKSDTDYVIFCDSRRWLYEGHLKKNGEIKHSFSVNVCDIHKYNQGYIKKEHLLVGVLGDVEFSCELHKANYPTVYLAGDSTVTDQPAEYPYNPASTYCGWGQMLPLVLKEGLAVSNHAESGSSTGQFLGCNWLVLEKRIKPGDFLAVQFGHNDQKQPHLDPFGGYAKNLRHFVKKARELGANPILCSPINRIIFEENGKIKNLLGDYRNSVKQISLEENVPFIDLWAKTTEFFEKVGPVDSWDYFWSKGNDRDYTHTNDIGGKLVAKFFAQAIVKNKVSGFFEFIILENIETPVPKPSGRKETGVNVKDLSQIGLVNLPELDRDITNIKAQRGAF